MTRDEINTEYPFIATLSDENLEKLLGFIMVGLVEMSFVDNKKEAKIVKFVEVLSQFRREKQAA